MRSAENMRCCMAQTTEIYNPSKRIRKQKAQKSGVTRRQTICLCCSFCMHAPAADVEFSVPPPCFRRTDAETKMVHLFIVFCWSLLRPQWSCREARTNTHTVQNGRLFNCIFGFFIQSRWRRSHRHFHSQTRFAKLIARVCQRTRKKKLNFYAEWKASWDHRFTNWMLCSTIPPMIY